MRMSTCKFEEVQRAVVREEENDRDTIFVWDEAEPKLEDLYSSLVNREANGD